MGVLGFTFVQPNLRCFKLAMDQINLLQPEFDRIFRLNEIERLK